ICTVYSYPSEPLPNGDALLQPVADQVADGTLPAANSRTAGAENGFRRGGRPALKLEALFVQHMPVWKRLLDIAGAVVGMTLLLPLFAVVALAVKFSSPGPVIFRQWRSGRGGQPFVMYKFRTMVADAEVRKAALLPLNEQDGPAFKVSDDPRVTAIGRFLRRTS